MRTFNINFCRPLFALSGLLVLGTPAVAAEKLADRLAQLETTAAPAAERKALAGMVAEAIQRRRQELNERNTAAWQAVKSRADWERFLKPKLTALQTSLGQFPPPPRSLNVHVTGTVAGAGFHIDNLVLESRPGLWVSANLYKPSTPGAAMPGFVICHSQHTPKEHFELQDMGMTWARAGCLVLVMDQLGHGERRQHPFVNAGSYAKKYQVSRQDYYFRYDNGIQLHLLGDSLIGWMVWDLRRGVDLLLAQKGIDPKRIILLGSVAGGGDPGAVAAALDERFACVAPFNFGVALPKPRYRYPDGEPRWNFVGSGSWESTRNLRGSAADGFLPWVIVAAAAPRHLVYAHEFAWYPQWDPVWKRLQAVYAFYNAADRLSFTFGRGDVTGKPPEATHCTHIGFVHRKMMHPDFQRWFAIAMTSEKEYHEPLPSAKLQCWTPAAKRDLKPRQLSELLGELAGTRMEQARQRRAGKSQTEQRRQLQAEWARILGDVQPHGRQQARSLGADKLENATVERLLLTVEPGIVVPTLLLLPARTADKKVRVVVAVCQAGKAALLRARAAEVAGLLEAGVAVCLPDVRATGETGWGGLRGRSSAATTLSSSQLMLGEPLVAGQLRDLRAVLAWLRTRGDVDAARPLLWGDSLAPFNAAGTDFVIPRDSDAALPQQSEPLGGLLALLAALYEDGVQAVYARGGLAGFRTVLDGHLALIPHDVVVPGVLQTGDLVDIVAALAPCSARLEAMVDGRNRRLGAQPLAEIFQQAVTAYRASSAAEALTIAEEASSPVHWLLAQVRRR